MSRADLDKSIYSIQREALFSYGLFGKTGANRTHAPLIWSQSVLPIIRRPHTDGVGFEPTGLTPQQISGLRRYNHFGNHPQNGAYRTRTCTTKVGRLSGALRYQLRQCSKKMATGERLELSSLRTGIKILHVYHSITPLHK